MTSPTATATVHRCERLLVHLFADFVSHRLFAYLDLYLGASESFGVRGNCWAIPQLDASSHSGHLRLTILLNLVEIRVESVLF
jgi:hypothetical protein